MFGSPQSLMLLPLLLIGAANCTAAESLWITPRLHHLRQGTQREWDEFPAEAEGESLELSFAGPPRKDAGTLELRQQDVKQSWEVTLNEKPVGRLTRDENDMVVYLDVPLGTLREGENRLRIASSGGGAPDDMRVGQIRWHAQPRAKLLRAAELAVTVTDQETGAALPARVTIVRAEGPLQSVGAESGGPLAVRPGTVYTADGVARFGLPPGNYRIFAGRGFEYSLDSAEVTLKAGQSAECALAIRREVPTPGYVACDTHIHSLTHSGHGDATVQERMVTLAAEGIELPIATDHNVHVDYEPFARQAGVRQYFTPVIGNEVTTRSGHFNVFPVEPGSRVPDPTTTDWNELFGRIYRTPGVKVAILNHARDTHSGVRPFGPELFNDVTARQLDGWAMRFNAMEVLNSSATQTDILQLFHDWMALLNRGCRVTPVGSSDSHDVARHFVGQGRTYIRCHDEDPARIDVDAAVVNFLQGEVLVSYGLLAELTVERKYRSGELARAPDDSLHVSVRVLGPHWTSVEKIVLYANGVPIREVATESRDAALPRGVHWQQQWDLPRPEHDVHLVALALGPGIEQPYWRTAKPYQPDSPAWHARTAGCSGAVWVDADKDGRFRCAREYARQVDTAHGGELPELLKRLAQYDQAVASQAAELYQARTGDLLSDAASAALNEAAPQVREGFRRYLESWRANQLARGGR